MRRVLCIWLSHWPLQRLAFERPALERQALVLQETVRGVQRVADCTEPARALGIRPGMPVAEAAALGYVPSPVSGEGGERSEPGEGGRKQARSSTATPAPLTPGPSPETGEGRKNATAKQHTTCNPPVLIWEPYDPQADREALQRLALGCYEFSPLVGIESAEFPECLLLDATGLEHLFGGEPALVEKVSRELARQGWKARLAIADTIGAAWALAHYGQHATAIVPCDQLAAALRPLPIEGLRLPPGLAADLRQLGIERIEQLEALPRKELTCRFGPALLERWNQARGLLDEPLVPYQPPPTARAECTLEHPTARRDAIEHLLAELVEQVAAQLLRHGLGALKLECRLVGEKGDKSNLRDDQRCASVPASGPFRQIGLIPFFHVRLSVGLFRPTVSPRHLFPLIQMQLERARLPASVAAIELEATHTAPLEQQQRELFPREPAPRHPEQLAVLIERLSSRLGNDAVVRVRLVADAQPELAYRTLPLVQDRYRRPTPSRVDPERLPPRPLKLLPRPAPVEAVAIEPDGPPVQFAYRGRQHRAIQTWGPERIETGWWRGRTVGRDYYRIETASGERYWLFRRLRDGAWFLHGMFE